MTDDEKPEKRPSLMNTPATPRDSAILVIVAICWILVGAYGFSVGGWRGVAGLVVLMLALGVFMQWDLRRGKKRNR